MIDQSTIDRILDVAKIEEVVSEFVTLRRRGVNLVGLCPFHTDKSPSFYVSPAKNICKCFACGEGGTAVHFIMKHEQLSYHDALRYLAKKYHIEIEERELTDKEKQMRSDRESMLIVNGWAQEYFSQQLHESEEGISIGLRYFRERGFRDDIIRKFRLGYAPEQRDALYQAATKKGYRKEYLEKTGLVIAYDNGRVNDRFRGRVIFPVHTLSGKIVAFGGRILKKDEKSAKYVNSPESEIYHKSRELYGIYFAKQPIMKADRCYLVEGYTDVISMHQAGIENVVASSGTALTDGQIRLIQRFTNNITVLYDGDAAGIKAALRGIDMLLEVGMNVKVVLLPNGEDPDSFARKHNATQFHEFIAAHENDFIRFKTHLLLDEAGNDPIKRSTLITDIIRSVSVIPDNIARSVYIKECSAMMETDERVILNEVNKLRQKREEKRQEPVPPTAVAAPGEMPPPPDFPGYGGAMPPPDIPPASYSGDAPPPPPPPPGLSPEEQLQAAGQRTTIGARRSPYEAYELTLLRYIVRYGERVIFDEVAEEEAEENANDGETLRVASYIRMELEQDDLTFYNPLYRQMMEEAADRCHNEGFLAARYFLSHPDPTISQLAANLMGDKYQLSKYHTKYQEISTEESQLEQLVIKELFSIKQTFVDQQIKAIQQKIKAAYLNKEEQEVMELLKQQSALNELKNILCKELGERIILKM